MKSEIDDLIAKTLSDFSESRHELNTKNSKTENHIQPTSGEVRKLKHAVVNEVKQHVLPTHYAYACLALFVVTNIAVGVLVSFSFYYDIYFIINDKNIDRLITPHVIMSLIAGITVQTGTAFLLITKYFFRAEQMLNSEIKPNISEPLRLEV